MEDWQALHITENLEKLSRLTNCTPLLFANLIVHNILSDEDVSILNATLGSSGAFDQSKLLYNILTTRIGGFETLASALYKTNQLECLHVINQAYSDHGTAIPDFEKFCLQIQDITENTKWGDLSETLKFKICNKPVIYERTSACLSQCSIQYDFGSIGGLGLLELVQTESPILVNNQVSDDLDYYIQRKIKSRSKLQNNVFQSTTNDVFVLHGVPDHQINSLVGAYATDSSSNQIYNLTVRFIILEDELHFEKIRKLTTAPVHWIKYKDQGCELFQSSGSIKNLQKYVHEIQNTYEEDILFSCGGKVVVISDSPGMGKTVLATKIANVIMKQEETRLVRFMVMIEVVKALKNHDINIDTIISLIADQSSEYEFGKKLVAHNLKTTPSILIFDGFDEVMSKDTDVALLILKTVSEGLDLVRVFVTTRPHMRDQVENSLHVLGYTIEPFEEQDQRSFLIKYWESEGVSINESVHQFASICLNSLLSKITDTERDIAGIPLQCRLLAEVYTENAIRCSKVGYYAYQHSVNLITSIFEMYERHMDHRLRNDPKLSTFSRFLDIFQIRKNSFNSAKYAHMYYALELLFPEHAHEFHQINPFLSVNELCTLGILEKNVVNTIRFVHRTFAEYFIAWFAVETNPCDQFLSFLINELLGTKSISENITSPFGKSSPIPSCTFDYPVISYFINGFTKKLSKNRPGSYQTMKIQELINSVQFSQVAPIFFASSVNNYTHVPLAATLLQQNLQSRHLSNMAELVLITSKYSGIELMKTYCSQLDLKSMKFLYSKRGSFYITPLHLAVLRGQYNLVEYLVNKYDDEVTNLPFLIHFCVYESLNTNQAKLEDKKQIIKLLMLKSTHWAEEKLPDDNTEPILQSNVHVELVECLIKCGNNVNDCDRNGNTILHKVTENPVRPEAYHQVALALVHQGFQHFDKPNIQMWEKITPLHCAVKTIDLLDETLELFDSKHCNFNALDDFKDSILFYAIIGGRTVELIEKLIKHGADWKHVNMAEEGVLHICAREGHHKALKYFIKTHQINVNAMSKSGTPLHLAVLSRSVNHDISQKILMLSGADVNAIFGLQNDDLISLASCEGKGLSLKAIKLMEENGLVITSDLAQKAFNNLFRNYHLNFWEIDHEYAQVLKYLYDKGGRLEVGGNPWLLENVQKTLSSIMEATSVTSELLSQSNTFGLLKKSDLERLKGLSSALRSQQFYKLAEENKSTLELIYLSLILSNQTNAYMLIHQSFLTSVDPFGLFVSPPPGMLAFIHSELTRVMVLLTTNVDLTIKRIENAAKQPIVVTKELDLYSNADTMTVLLCQSISNHLINHLLAQKSKQKIICVSSQADEELENCHVHQDALTWDDISSPYIRTVPILLDGIDYTLPEVFVTPEIIQTLLTTTFVTSRTSEQYEIVETKIAHEQTLNPNESHLSSTIFNFVLHDKFIFQGISEEELRQYSACGHRIGHFGEDVENLDFLIIKEAADFKQICIKTKCNVHLVEHYSGNFKLVQTYGFDNEIKSFIEIRPACTNFPYCKCDSDNLIVHFSFHIYCFYSSIRLLKCWVRIRELHPRLMQVMKMQDSISLFLLLREFKNVCDETDASYIHEALLGEDIEGKSHSKQLSHILNELLLQHKYGNYWEYTKRAAVNTLFPKKSAPLTSVINNEDLAWSIVAELVVGTETAKTVDLNFISHFLHECKQHHVVLIKTHMFGTGSKTIQTLYSDPIHCKIFKNDRVFNLMDNLVGEHIKMGKSVNLSIYLKRNISKRFAAAWTYACVIGNHYHLLKLLMSLGAVPKIIVSVNLLTLAVMYADIPILELILNQFVLQKKPSVENVELELETNVIITILHVAAMRGRYFIVEKLLCQHFKKELHKRHMRNILQYCVVDTQKLQGEKLDERKRIVNLFVQFQPSLTQEKDKFNRPVLLRAPNIHVDLIRQLISLGMDVNSTDNHSENILHYCANYMGPMEYDHLVCMLLARQEFKGFQVNKLAESTPLHYALQRFEMLESTIEMLSTTSYDMNADIWAYGFLVDTPLIQAVKYQRSARLLHALIRAGANIHKVGDNKNTVLHMAANMGNLTALRIFISLGCDVNARNGSGNTPIHQAFSFQKANTHEVVKELIAAGANVNFIGSHSLTPLSTGRFKMQYDRIENSTLTLLKEAGAK